MTIERIEKSHWFGKTKIRTMLEGESEMLEDYSDYVKILVVDSPDQVVVETYGKNSRNGQTIRSYDRLYKDELNSSAGQEKTTFMMGSLWTVINGGYVKYAWKPNGDSSA